MTRFSTRQAAKKLGISHDTLAHYIEVGKVPSPEVFVLGEGTRAVHAWTADEIEYVRTLLPKVANGRKTRWQKLRKKKAAPAGVHAPQEKTQPRTVALPKSREKTKKKK
jgi:predicted DNA-binding transcriptional regulator AlpA